MPELLLKVLEGWIALVLRERTDGDRRARWRWLDRGSRRINCGSRGRILHRAARLRLWTRRLLLADLEKETTAKPHVMPRFTGAALRAALRASRLAPARRLHAPQQLLHNRAHLSRRLCEPAPAAVLLGGAGRLRTSIHFG
ncbi:MAG TPA: hypothetical protein VKV26_19710 [Dehalococcoidia bacterium]|nr:hypothetical protein [Dehalococcoidia bacterium]